MSNKSNLKAFLIAAALFAALLIIPAIVWFSILDDTEDILQNGISYSDITNSDVTNTDLTDQVL